MSPIGERGAAPPVPRMRPPAGGRGSAGGQRAVAELGEGVDGLTDDLARLGQGGALAVDPLLHLRVVGVVRGRGTSVGLAGLIDAPAARPAPAGTGVLETACPRWSRR